MDAVKVSPILVAALQPACVNAVDAAIERWHRDNPAGFHHAHPMERHCRFDPECPFKAGR
jgi:hypothetical protein